MKISVRARIVFSLLCVSAASSAAAFPRAGSVPPDSFLDYHVANIAQLSYEVAHDARVRHRLAHHFHLTSAQMCRYVRENLMLEYLKTPLRTRDYCITAQGKEFYVIMTMKKGSAVFGEHTTGKPILRLVCGNPLAAKLPPAPKKTKKPKPPVPVANRVEAAKIARAVPAAPAPAATAAPAVPSPAAPVFTAPAIFQTVGSGQVLVTEAGSAASMNWLSGIPALAAVFVAGRTGAGTTIIDTNTPLVITPVALGNTFIPAATPPHPVPEPDPLVGILVGSVLLCGLGLYQRSRLRRSGQ